MFLQNTITTLGTFLSMDTGTAFSSTPKVRDYSSS